ncbi:MAG: LptF/LptG family permease [Candidatus Symbiothrix sp.]|jgi:lipopolysaccharide export system permease protein|nr:LptF/LptG family permease [Candidatus Symbiothrix sp.]
MFRIKKLYTFILGAFLPLLLVTFSICLFVLLMQYLWTSIADMVGKGVGVGVLLQFFSYVSMWFLPNALPLSVLMASLMAFGNLGEHFELTAMKAAGISLLKIMKPLIIFVLLMCGISFVFQNNIQPRARLKMAAIMVSLRQKSPELDIPEGIFYREITGYNVFVRKKDKKSGILHDMMIYDYSDGFENAKVIVADSGKLKVTEDKKYLVLSLYQGESFENMKASKRMSYANDPIPYRRETFKFREVLIDFDTSFSIEDESVLGSRADGKNINDLVAFIDSVKVGQDSINQHGVAYMKRTAYLNTFKDVASTRSGSHKKSANDSLFADGFQSYFDRLSLDKKIQSIQSAKSKTDQVPMDYAFTVNQQNDANTQLRAYKIQLQAKFTLSLACLLFFFIGAPLGAIIRKGGLGMPTVLSVFLYLTYYTINDFGTKMARTGTWDIWLGVWLSTFLLLALGIFFTYQAINDSTMFNAEVWKKGFNRVTKALKRKRPAKAKNETN